MSLFQSLLFCLTLNFAVFIPAYIYQTDKLTDITYAITFASVAVYSAATASTITTPAILITGMVCLWAARLGGFLFRRILKHGRDKRFDEMRPHFWRFGGFWLIQGVSTWLISLPVILFLSRATSNFATYGYVGLALWAIGLGIEAVADWQKNSFNAQPANKGRWIDSGLWLYSRHPNYFGEILLWCGIGLFAFAGLPFHYGLIGLLSPLYTALLIIFLSGLPLVEKAADEKWGHLPAYQQYKEQTSILIPLPVTTKEHR
ncbi:MAG: DUF1295 domain-containing protein [Candidatus Dependentiae bacterium]|jgi:steroid 5-alpha reductase family enzyme